MASIVRAFGLPVCKYPYFRCGAAAASVIFAAFSFFSALVPRTRLSVLSQSRLGSTPWCQRGATAVGLVMRTLRLLALAGFIVSSITGCAIFGRHRQSPEAVEAA